MNKEEILKSSHAEKVINWDKVFVQNPTIIQSAYEAMDTYAKQEAIAFLEWKTTNGWMFHINDVNEWLWYKGDKIFTTEQLYSIYQQSK